jgi:hypothetical protein
MPKYSPSQLRADAPHRVKVKLSIRDDEGNKQIVETDVYYRGISLDTTGQIPDIEGKEGQDRLDVLKAQLAMLVSGIPDFGVGLDLEQKPDAEFFGGLEDANIDAISNAIAEDRDPNTKPSNS